jgi:hypothetical protein
MTGRVLDGGDHLEHRKTAAVADISAQRLAARAKAVQREEVRVDQVGNVDVVAYAGPVGCGKIRAEDFEPLFAPNGHLAGSLNQMCGAWRALSGAALRVCAGDIEVTKSRVPEIVRVRRVRQYPFARQL